jgi:hypothetical protein
VIAHRLARDFQLDAVTLMNKPIEDGVGESRFAEVRMPGVDR